MITVHVHHKTIQLIKKKVKGNPIILSRLE